MFFVSRLMFNRLYLFLFIGLFALQIRAQSVLATGKWFKVGVTQTGVYKLDKSFLSSLGLPSSFDPRTLKVYGNGGGGMLPQSNAIARPTDLLQNAIHAVGQADGTMDTGDYFLFYGKGPDYLKWEASGFNYEKNLYSDTAFYFITFEGDLGLRINTVASAAEQPNKITSFDDVIIHETDKENLISSGRRWFGEVLSPATGLTANFNYTVSNVLSLKEAKLNVMAQSEGACSMLMSVNSNVIGSVPINAIPGSTYSEKGIDASGSFSLSGSVSSINVGLTFQPNGSPSISFVDWFSIQMTRSLIFSGNQLGFRSISSLDNSISSYQLASAPAGLLIWDVTNPIAPQQITYQLSGGSAIFSTSSNEIHEFVALNGSNFSAPYGLGKVLNQSIRSTTNIDGIIITHPKFQSEAQRLADFHSSHDNLDITVVTVGQVYNEFSSGMQDVSAIRDYARHVYNAGAQQLKYLLLFGDASYDYKNRLSINANFIPTYESRESFHPIFSFASDDYFGFLETEEGEWTESFGGDHTMEIGIGRLPVREKKEATTVVNKIIRYVASPTTLGTWRNRSVYVVDDGDNNLHAKHAEALSDILIAGKNIDARKLYLDSFDQIINPSNEESPKLTNSILKSINDGALLVNYIGHGNETQWMDERVFTPSEINELRNYQKLPIFVTATCQFGKYDGILTSGAERLLNGDQGAIALLSTSRLVFASTNFILNQAFHASFVAAEYDKSIRLGDIIRETKNNSLQGAINRNFTLLGDPMLRPAFPKYDVVLDQFQGPDSETVSALQRITLTGTIQDNDQVISGFNGKINVVIYDVPVEKVTKGQESTSLSYYEQDNALFRGEASVVNGVFSAELIVPKNISYSNGQGRISLYAWDSNTGDDAAGQSSNILIGGTNKEANPDNSSPMLNVYINEPSFRNGSRVGPGAVLIARFVDESGMNISNSGFDRGITMELNDQFFELNEYYTADSDDFTKGTVVYPLSDLAPGLYTAIIKGTDVYNNPIQKSVEFVVANQPILQTFNFNTYPNPARSYTNFRFDHDREGESLQLEVIIYSVNGDQAVVESRQVEFSDRSVELEVDFSNRLPNDGLYVYKLSIRSLADGALAELTGRLVIRN
jgi:hypothetical protein